MAVGLWQQGRPRGLSLTADCCCCLCQTSLLLLLLLLPLLQACQRALEKSAFRLRRELAKVLATKFTPRLEFRWVVCLSEAAR